MVLEGQMKTIEKICGDHHAIGMEFAATEEERDTLWKARRGGTAALVRQADRLVTLDYAVPVSLLPRALKLMEKLANEHHCNVVTIAHAADGNLHPMVALQPGRACGRRRLSRLLRRLHPRRARTRRHRERRTRHRSGKEAVHAMQLGDEQMRIMRGICRLFDPYAS